MCEIVDLRVKCSLIRAARNYLCVCVQFGYYYVVPSLKHTREVPPHYVKGGGPSPLNKPPWTRILLTYGGKPLVSPRKPPFLFKQD